MADNFLINALKGVNPADAMPFGAAATPEGSPTALSAMLSGLFGMPKHLVEGAQNATPGLRRQDVTDIPGKGQPNDPLYNTSADMAMALAGAGAPAAEVGAAGIFGGKLAKTADIKALIEANKMNEAGKTQAAIFGDTGWFKNPTDHKWKFEIPDTGSRVLQHQLDYTKDGRFLAGSSGDIFQHSKLYEAYPELAKHKMYNTVLHDPVNGIGRGQFNGNTIPPIVSIEAPNLNNAKSVALHEMQHGVQRLENFAPGGNVNSMAYLQEKFPENLPLHEVKSDPVALYKRLAGEVESRNVQKRMDFDPSYRRIVPPWETHDTYYKDQLVYDPRYNLVKALKHSK